MTDHHCSRVKYYILLSKVKCQYNCIISIEKVTQYIWRNIVIFICDGRLHICMYYIICPYHLLGKAEDDNHIQVKELIIYFN